MQINSICVCGAGTMGSGIAQVAAQAGFPVILYDLNAAILSKARAGVENSLQQLVAKGKMDSDNAAMIFNRILFTGDLQHCIADLFIEAVIEDANAKTTLFNQLAFLNSPDAIFASNTSSLSVTAIARKIKSPGRIIGLHFFNPAPIMKLVEIVKTEFNSDALLQEMVELVHRLGKTAVICNDSPGFIVNRVARPYYIESLRLLEENKSNHTQIDELMEASGFKLGPFRLMDLIGNDVNYAVSCSVYDQLGKPGRLKPSEIQEKKVRAGKLGRKSGEGYYKY
jgi:3-hydroxybutyryl-CoA dehydrogenase